MTLKNNPTRLSNGQPVLRSEIPLLDEPDFRQTLLEGVIGGWRVSSFFACEASRPEQTELYAVLTSDEERKINIFRTVITGDSFASMTPECTQVHLFEREIAEQYGLTPMGHPWLKPVRYHHAWGHRDAWGRLGSAAVVPGSGSFYQVSGEQVHEVAVGPVHAGIIEPGHFRFQCQGEEVLHLEIALGYQHRGIEKRLTGGPDKRSLHYMETAAGDTTIGHALTYCQTLEALAGARVPERGGVLRGIALELERIANHVGDLGALANDVGFLPTASFCGRIRGEWLNLTALLCGNRFGRNFIVPGGTAFDLTAVQIESMQKKIEILEKETKDAVCLLWENQSVLSRFEEIGEVSRETAVNLGLVGPAARASGLYRDIRYNFPSGSYKNSGILVSVQETGDVLARAYVRWLEIQQGIAFILEQLVGLPIGVSRIPIGPLASEQVVVTVNEGWRGEICHVAITNTEGAFRRYKVVDPSFHNWAGLAMALRNQGISDFPICNKSFNLSYCGHDL